MRGRYAVIPSNGRPVLYDAIEAIKSQVDHVICIIQDKDTGLKLRKLQIHYQVDMGPKNISRWWNNGLNLIDDYRSIQQWETLDPEFDIAVINDDVIVPEGWFDAVSTTMRDMGAVAGCSGGTSGVPVLNTVAAPVSLATRLQGFAFILAGERGLRANEALAWWCGDDDLDWRARQLGGVVMVPGVHVNHLYPNGQITPELHAQIAQDMQTFVDIWGTRPW